ncbi:MAG: ornithine cyclodeaminase family protein [Candidatus Aminicenantes bacterium]
MMLCLSERDLIQAASRKEIVDVVEKSLRIYEEKRFFMPDRMHIDYGGDTLLLMPCFASGCLGTKLVTLFPGNAGKNLPVLNGVMILNDGKTGEPLALLNGSALTALRTGAVGAAGINLTTPENASVLGVIGAGVQGHSQAVTACTQRNFQTIWIHDLISEKIRALKLKLEASLPGVDILIASSAAELVKNAGVVITATPATEPVIPDDPGLTAGKNFIGIGSYKPEMREFPRAVYTQIKKLYIDTDYALEESGDVIAPLEKGWIRPEQVMTLGKRLTGKAPAPEPGETTVFKSVGMALFDLIVSAFLYRKAKEQGLGQEAAL